jgi:uncharacterized protein
LILIDTNLMLYASMHESVHHVRAQKWVEQQFSSGTRIGLPWHTLLGYVRLASQRRTYRTGPSVKEAWREARGWIDHPNVWIPHPTIRHVEIVDRLLSGDIGNRLVMDIHLAALAIEHGLTLCSNDNDFSRFKELRWLNPLDD